MSKLEAAVVFNQMVEEVEAAYPDVSSEQRMSVAMGLTELQLRIESQKMNEVRWKEQMATDRQQ